MVETVIHMAHSLGMSAIVEWVETAAQVEIVRSFNADAAQGFFFSRPMSGEDAASLAAGAEVPQFSRTEIRTLVRSHGSEDEPETGSAAGRAGECPTGDDEARRNSIRVGQTLTRANPSTRADHGGGGPWAPTGPAIGSTTGGPGPRGRPAVGATGPPVGGDHVGERPNLLYTSRRETRRRQRVAPR